MRASSIHSRHKSMFSRKPELPPLKDKYIFNVISEDSEKSKMFFESLVANLNEFAETENANVVKFDSTLTLRNEVDCRVQDKRVDVEVSLNIEFRYTETTETQEEADISLVMFDTNNAFSVEWAKDTLPQLDTFCALLGRTDQSVSDSPVSYLQGIFLASSFEAIGYFEVSRTDLETALEVFKHTISINTIHLRKFKGTHADYSNTGLHVFPGFLSSVKTLNKMTLAHNNIVSIDCMQLINTKFAGLLKIDLSYNKLKKLPPAFGTLINLRVANLSHNQLTSLPNTFADCYNLKELNLSDNEFLVVPRILSMLKALNHLCIDNNPFLEYIDFAEGKLDKKSLDRLINYVVALEENETAEFPRMKVMFVGDGGVGKTSLLNYMKNNKPTVEKFNVATDGIDITEISTQDNVKLDCWDFAGQKLYYSTHQFFLTKRALYLVVFNLKSPNFGNIEYWLKSVRQRERTAPIVMIGTHLDQCDEEEATVNAQAVQKLARKYKIESFEVLSTVSKGKHIKKLQEKLIEVGKTRRLLGGEVPKYYTFILKTIRDLKKTSPWLFLNELISHVDYLDRTETEILDAVSYLHDKGYLLYFKEEYKVNDLVILDPQYLNDVMTSIVSLSNTFENGRISEKILTNVLQNFSGEIHGKILAILETFEIIFKLPAPEEEERTYVVPCMLPETPDDFFLNFEKIRDDRRIVGREYNFNFVPFGFFSRLIARVMSIPAIEILSLWENGMVVKSYSQESIVTYDSQRYSLQIVSHSKCETICNLNLMNTLIQSIDSLMDVFYVSDKHKLESLIPIYGARNVDTGDIPYVTLREAISKFVRSEKISIDNVEYEFSDFAPDVSKLETFVLPPIENPVFLGEGGFGTVYKGELNGQIVAIKTLKISVIDDELEKFQEFLHEVNVMRQFDHPNLVKLYGTTLNPLGMVIEFCPFTSLDNHLADTSLTDEDFPLMLRIKIMHDIALGIKCLHSFRPPVVHRDVRSPNVFISSMTLQQGVVNAKLGDFGLAQYALPALSEMLTSWQWLAPEVFSATSSGYGPSADIYSFGMVFWEILTRQIPYCEFDDFVTVRSVSLSDSDLEDHGLLSSLSSQGYSISGSEAVQEIYKEHDIKEAIIVKHLRPTLPTIEDVELEILIRQCWSANPSDRPTIDEVIAVLSPLLSREEFSLRRSRKNSIKGDEVTKPITELAPSALISTETDSSIVEVRGNLKIARISGVNLPDYSNIYIKIRYGGTTYRTKQIKKTEEKIWEIDLDLECWFTSKITVEVQSKRFIGDQSIGHTFFMPIASVPFLPLFDTSDKDTSTTKPGLVIDYKFVRNNDVMEPRHIVKDNSYEKFSS